MKKILLTFFVAGLTHHAMALGVEPDNFVDGDVLNTVSPFVTLSVEVPDTGSPDGLRISSFDVTASPGDTAISDASPTGDLVFSHEDIPFFNDIRVLRGDFSGVTSSVSISFSPDSTISDRKGRLEAYDNLGNLLAFDETPLLMANQTSVTVDVLSITRGSSDIAYFRAWTIEGNFGRFDDLNFARPVPEPASAGLLAAGLVFLRHRRR